MTTPLLMGVSPNHQLAVVNLKFALADAANNAAGAGLPLGTIALTLDSAAKEVESFAWLPRAKVPLPDSPTSWPTPPEEGADLPEERDDPVEVDEEAILWNDLEEAPRDGRFLLLAPKDDAAIPDDALWVGNGVVATWSTDETMWALSTNPNDLSTMSVGWDDSTFFAFRLFDLDSVPARRQQPSEAPDFLHPPLHPPKDPIPVRGAELTLTLPEYVTIRSTKLTAADQAILLQLMQEASKAPEDGLAEPGEGC